VLDSIQSPQDIKQLDLDQLQSLVDEIRAFLIENIQKQVVTLRLTLVQLN